MMVQMGAFRNHSLLRLLALAATKVIGAQESSPADLSNWYAETYPSGSGRNWDVAGDNLSVVQTENGDPTFFCSDFTAIGTATQGLITPLVGGSTDTIGFALGFNQNDTTNRDADYLLISWQKQTQTWRRWPEGSGCTRESTNEQGLAVSRVSGIPTLAEFWGQTDFNDTACSPLGEGLELLQRGINFGDVGWEPLVDYNFRFEFSATELLVFLNGVLELNITGQFQNGNMCFYNFSQRQIRYSGFTVESLPEVPSTAPSPIPGVPTAPTPPPVESTPAPTMAMMTMSMDYNIAAGVGNDDNWGRLLRRGH